MGWTVRGSNSGVGEIFRTRPDGPSGPPSLLYNGYWVCCSGVKRPGRGAIPMLSLWAFVACSRVNITFTFNLFTICLTTLPATPHSVDW